MMKLWPLALGAGMAAGAVAVMMLPKDCAARKMATDAADKMEETVYTAMDKMTGNTHM